MSASTLLDEQYSYTPSVPNLTIHIHFPPIEKHSSDGEIMLFNLANADLIGECDAGVKLSDTAAVIEFSTKAAGKKPLVVFAKRAASTEFVGDLRLNWLPVTRQEWLTDIGLITAVFALCLAVAQSWFIALLGASVTAGLKIWHYNRKTSSVISEARQKCRILWNARLSSKRIDTSRISPAADYAVDESDDDDHSATPA